MQHSKWAAARSVVAGRLINCYAWNDWLLALLYRSKSYDIGVAGLYPIHLQPQHAAGGECKSLAVSSVAAAGVGGGSAVTGPSETDPKTGGANYVTAAEHFAAELQKAQDGNEAIPASTPAPAPSRRLELKSYRSPLEVENYDVSHLISSHSDYPNVLPTIVAMLQL
jgi:hypothetical protein